MFSTDAPHTVPEEGRPSTPLSPLGASGVALTTAAIVFALGVYAVETDLPERTASGRADPAASPANTDAAGHAGAVRPRQAAVPVQPSAPPPANVPGDAARSVQVVPPQPNAEAAAPPPQPSAEAAAPPPLPSAEAAAPPPLPSAEVTAHPPPPRDEAATAPPAPRRGHGWLKINSAHSGTVYVTGVAVGPSNTPVEVRCGRFFVRLGEPTRNGTRWLAEGRTVIIPCGKLTEASF